MKKIERKIEEIESILNTKEEAILIIYVDSKNGDKVLFGGSGLKLYYALGHFLREDPTFKNLVKNVLDKLNE